MRNMTADEMKSVRGGYVNYLGCRGSGESMLCCIQDVEIDADDGWVTTRLECGTIEWYMAY